MTATGPSPQEACTSPAGGLWRPLRVLGVLILVVFAGLWIDLAGTGGVRAPGGGGLAAADKSHRVPALIGRDAMRAVLSAERNREPACGGLGGFAGLLPAGSLRFGRTWSAGAALAPVQKAAVCGHRPAGFRPRGPPAPFV